MPSRYALRRHGQETDVERECLIGRGSDCGVRIDETVVSRRHALISVIDDRLFVEDLGSRAGVMVNKRKISAPTKLAHGDLISIGQEVVAVVDRQALPPPPDSVVTAPPPRLEPEGALTARETEVLRLLVHGHSQKEIAQQLHLSVKTVETHRTRLANKLNCHSRADLVAYAMRAGLLGG